MQSLKIVFFGTPQFAVPVLEKLAASNHRVVAVVTAPDKPAGRGMKLQHSEVKESALQLQLPILQPEKLKNPEFINALAAYEADVFVVVAFRMLPEIVWNMPPLGSFNLHASLLPQYRGAAPINWAIINGEKETGLTTFKLQQEIDTGNIVLQEKIAISDDMDVASLYTAMMYKGADLMLQTINLLAEGNVTYLPQSDSKELRHAPKIFKENCKIDFSKTVNEVYNHIRGLSPYPAAFTRLNGLNLKVYKAQKNYTTDTLPIGIIATDGKTFLQVKCADGYIVFNELQLEGKKRMEINEFLRGNKIMDAMITSF